MLTEKPWKIDAVLLLGFAIFFSLFAAVSVGLGINYFLPDLPLDEKKFFNFLTNTLGFHGMTLVLVTPFLWFHQTNWTDLLGLNQTRLWRRAFFGLAIGALLVPLGLRLNKLAAELIVWLHLTPDPQPNVQVLKVSVSLWQRACFGFAAIVLAPIAEEALFRGILYPLVKQLGRPWLAVFGTSLLFAAIHSNLMTFLPLFVFALVMIWLYERSNALVVPILAHALFNAANFTLFFFEPPMQPA